MTGEHSIGVLCAILGVSYTVGANDLAEFDVAGKHSFDLNTPYDAGSKSGFKSGGWAPSRAGNPSWLHGDYLDVAYTYVFPLYDNIINSGNLK